MRQLAGSITAILVTVMTTQQTNHLSAFSEELDKRILSFKTICVNLPSSMVVSQKNESITRTCQ